MMLLLLAFLLPWSIWRQLHPHAVTWPGLTKLPLIFAAVGALSITRTDLSAHLGTDAYLGASLALSVSIGALRGTLMPVWRTVDGGWVSQGNRTTIGLWGALIGLKFVLGAVASVTGALPTEAVGEIFLFLALSFAAQNAVLARRTLLADTPPVVAGP